MILPIAQCGDEVLTKMAVDVDNIHTPAVQTLIDNMIETMQAAEGVGIAAPQVFESKRIIIVASRPNTRYTDAPLMLPTAMINPEILWRSDTQTSYEEGCLSVPEQRININRPQAIRLRYLSRTGEQIESEYQDFVARIIQHEVDHLNGLIILDHATTDTYLNEKA